MEEDRKIVTASEIPEMTKAGEVLGTPALFIDGVVYRGGYDACFPRGRTGRMSIDG